MNGRRTALFLAEGTSDLPLGELVRRLFVVSGVELDVTAPDFALLEQRVARDLASRLSAAQRLMDRELDVLIVHRDVDRATRQERSGEVRAAMVSSGHHIPLVAVLPVRMTEAWLLLDEHAIRLVAGNPGGKTDLGLPVRSEIERIADPKKVLQQSLLAAADVTGRRRDRLASRFSSNRRLLLERLDPFGAVNDLDSWQALRRDVAGVAAGLV